MSNPVRVLQVIDSLGGGGAESLLYYFLKWAVRRKGFQFDVCTLYPGGAYEDRVRSLGVNILSLGLRRKYSLAAPWKLARLISAGQYDIIHVHLFPASAYVAIASLFVRNQVLFFTEHSERNRRRSLRLYWILDRLIYKPYQEIIAVGRTTQSNLVKWLPNTAGRVHVVENAVPVDELYTMALQLPAKNRDVDVLYVGRLVEAKGVDVILRALAKAQVRLRRTIKALLVGDGPLREPLESLAHQLGLKAVNFAGYQEQEKVYEWMRRSKVMVLASRWEGLPVTLLEGMAVGVPIVATAVGGIPEVIKDNVSGLLVQAGNDDALSSAICTLLTDASLRDRLMTEAYRVVKDRFDIERMGEQVLRLYLNALR